MGVRPLQPERRVCPRIFIWTRENVQPRSLSLPLAIALLGSLFAGTVLAAAQSLPAATLPSPQPRVVGDWRSGATVAIPFSKPALNPAAIDLGVAPADQPLARMLLLLAPAPSQQQALAAELARLQNPASPNYHQWLTPQAFARAYANSSVDVAAVAAWLSSQGFTAAPLPAGLGWVEFSGTAGEVEQAFGAQVHLISVSGSSRAVLASGIAVPAALAPVIAGLVSLDGSVSAPALTTPQPLTVSAADLASLASPAEAAAFTPRLAAQLLGVAPLASQGVNGAGQTIAIVSRSNVNSADVAAFRSTFELPASPLQVSISGPDPGLTDGQAEATFAASWAGAAAPAAKILLAPAASTSATDGVDLSLAAIADQNLANVVVVGYSACEAALSPAHQAFYSALYRQAAAEGITVVAAAGDSGAAACTPSGGAVPVSTGLAVNALASTPWNTAVGVAAYAAGGAGAGNSALAAWSPVNPADPAYASGGGSSTLYARRAWQPLPAELAGASSTAARNRLLPDLALPTAFDSSANPGLAFCLSGSGATSGCTLVRSGGSGVAAAYFAGIVALIDQKNGAQGNLTPSLYAASRIGGVFSDVTQGAAKLACAPGSSGCNANGQLGFAAVAGYDLATGLGVPDVRKLVSTLATASATTPTITLTVSPAQANNTYNPSAVVTFTATVVDPTGAGIPTGNVTMLNSANYYTLTPAATLVSSGSAAKGSSATFTLNLSSFYNYPSGTTAVPYKLGIGYNDPTGAYNATDDLDLLSVTSEPSPTVLAITPSTNSPSLGLTVTITVTAGVASSGPPAGKLPPTGSVTLTINGTSLSPVSFSTTGGVTSAVFSATLTAAANSIVASYAGDSNYSASTTQPYTLAASKAVASVVLAANNATAQSGASVTLTATVTPTAAPSGSTEPNPTGTVLFYNGTTLIGSAILAPASGADSSTATLSVQTLPGGSDSLTAVYQGDTAYGAATSNVVAINVQGFTLTASLSNPPTNLNIAKGGAASESFIVTSVGGYAGQVQVICTVPTQDDMTCGVSPQQVTPTATVTFVVQTYATGGPAYAALGKPRSLIPFWLRAAGGAMLAGVVFFLLPFGRRSRVFLRQGPRRFLVLLLLLSGLVGVGIGCSSSSTIVANTGTPLGVATLQVTATAYVDNAVAAQRLNFTVNVQPQ